MTCWYCQGTGRQDVYVGDLSLALSSQRCTACLGDGKLPDE